MAIDMAESFLLMKAKSVHADTLKEFRNNMIIDDSSKEYISERLNIFNKKIDKLIFNKHY